MDDEEILDLIWDRKEKGLKELEAKYGRQIERLAERILSKEDAKECINDTYLAVWNSIPLQKPKFLFAYAAKICRNAAYNKVQWNEASKRKAELVELSTELEQCIPDSAASPEKILEKNLHSFLDKPDNWNRWVQALPFSSRKVNYLLFIFRNF